MDDYDISTSSRISFNLNDFRVCWHKKMESVNFDHNNGYKNNNSNGVLENFNEEDNDDQYATCNTLIIKPSEQSITNKDKVDYRTLLEALIIKTPEEASNNGDVNSSLNNIQYSNQQLIEQITLFNKYNNSKINDLQYKHDNENYKNVFIIEGVLKLYWKLRNPIKISNQSIIPLSFIKTSNNTQNINEKLLDSNDLNNNSDSTLKSSCDDLTLGKKESIKPKNSKISRANTISYKDKPIRKPINVNSQYFIPSNNSVSGIHINNKTTCENAIKILFEKYHIQNSPNDYSLYKIMDTGEKRELNDADLPLMERLRMGPFDEDKIIVMEKNTPICTTVEIENLIRLPDNLLIGLIENLNCEEAKEIELLKARFLNYKEKLLERYKTFEHYV